MSSAKRRSKAPAQPGGDDGNGASVEAAEALLAGAGGPTPPQTVLELAAACVRFVSAAVKVEPDFQPETLPLVDHYLSEARSAVQQRPETLPLVANAVGAYLGEVVRRVHPCWWRLEGAEPMQWRLEFRDVYLSFAPMQVAAAALTRPDREPDDDDGGTAVDEDLEPEASFDEVPEPGLQLAPEDRLAVQRRLEDLPPVSDEEYYALSTRLEVIDIAVDAIQANLLAEPERRRTYRPDDYRQDRQSN